MFKGRLSSVEGNLCKGLKKLSEDSFDFMLHRGGGEYFQKQPTKANISISQDNPVLYPTNINVLYHSVPSLYTINHITHYVVDNSNIK